MNKLQWLAVAITISTVLGYSALLAAEAPQPLYNNIPPVKQTPAPFPLIPGSDIDLRGVPPATTVADANSRFDARAAAAVLSWSISNRGMLAVLKGGQNNEQDFGLAILTMFAQGDYFNDIPGNQPAGFNRLTASNKILQESPGRVGSTIDRDEEVPGPFPSLHIHSHGEYDVLLTAYITLYYKYYSILPTEVRNHIFTTLLSQRGQYDDSEKFSFGVNVDGIGVVKIPESENHRLMIQSAKYLTNQLYYQQSVSNGHPDHKNFDNNRNGDGSNNPAMVDVILGMLQAYLTRDFVEYNSRNYQNYTMTALLNLASYAYDDRVRLAARMVLDYISAKVAVSSNDLRRSPPFRRLNDEEHWGPEIAGGFLGSPLVFSADKPAPDPKIDWYGPDPQIAFYATLAGNTGMLFTEVAPHGLAKGVAPGFFTGGMVHAGLSDYRVPPLILDLFVLNPSHPNRRFFQAFHHIAGLKYVKELYAGSPSYLISAGGNPSFYAYTADIAGLSHPGLSADLGVALPTTFMPTGAGSGVSLTDLIQFGLHSADPDTVHLCVAPDFACGSPIYVPDAFEPANHVGDSTLVRDGSWTFVNRGKDATKPGYYVAIYRESGLPPSVQGAGLLEAYDTWLHGGSLGLSFSEFQRAVKRANPSIQLNIGTLMYTTQSGQHIQFTVSPKSAIISTTAEPDPSVYTDNFAHGSIINSRQDGQPLLPTGSGLITISNPVSGKRITLDMHSEARPGDPIFGTHHPSRTSESGAVEHAGTNEDLWVNFNYPGTGKTAGDFGDPFRTLAGAVEAVAVGGTINIVPGATSEKLPAISKRLTLKSFPGSAVIGQQ